VSLKDEVARKAYQREYNAKRKEQRKVYLAGRRDREWLLSIRRRASQNGIPFDLTEDCLVLPPICPVLGIPIKQGLIGTHPNSAQVDRFDNSKGYVKGNVRIISGRANYLKRDATLQELEAIVSYMKE